jgi:hypothetical protein
MTLQGLRDLPWDCLDKRNAGVKSDQQCQSSAGLLVRRVTFEDPVSGIIRVFITSEMTLLPGIIAELARRAKHLHNEMGTSKNVIFC